MGISRADGTRILLCGRYAELRQTTARRPIRPRAMGDDGRCVSIHRNAPEDALAPDAWQTWVRTGRRRALMSTRSLEYRSKIEQLPAEKDGEAMVQVIRDHFRESPHAFEHCAAAITRFMMPDVCHSACNIDPLSRGIGVQN